ncbi:MAG: ATP-binding cassette domain-containing protein [Gammaproteobacteria bacterium]|nr:ATP-binding cassette domain-containing protein [Gammaproteobacteria bacterium]
MEIKQEPKQIINISNLSAHYGERRILNNVSMAINDGEIMVIMGSSGSGKTTLLRSMLGLKKPTSGTIQLMDKEITTLSTKDLYKVRQQLGVSFQGGALFSSMSVRENIQLPLCEHTKLDQKTMDIMCRLKLEVVNLSGYENLMPAELSGGMLKRVALARSIIMDPRLLFFDEPSAGLDPVTSAELDELIITLKHAMKMTIVVVTHELESAFRIADRITVVDQGDILIIGTVEEVKNCSNERVQNLLNRRPRNDTINADEYLRRLTGAA